VRVPAGTWWRRLRGFGPAFRAALARDHLLWLAGAFAAERDRWFLWLPACFGGGIACYFLLPSEPPYWTGAILTLAALAAAGLYRRPEISIPLLAVAVFAAGLATATWRTAGVAAPVLERRHGPVFVLGRLLEVQPREGGVRLVLDRVAIERLAPAATPERIRINQRRAGEPLRPGQWVRVRAILLPPPSPAAPGAYDFARAAWFQRLGAVGFALSPAQAIPPLAEDGDALSRYRVWLGGVRQDLTQRIVAALPGPTGAVAAALMTGERGGIPGDVDAAFRDSGLAHLLSISGLHLALVAGVVFFAVRLVLALSERLTLFQPIKKIAAAAALLGAFAYLQLSGAAVPTQRSFVMAGLVLLAVMLDRNALSMRSVAWAALAVLVPAPESLLDASFQMSFGAVIALIAFYEATQARFAAWRANAGWLRRGLLYLAVVTLTTVVAGFATAPFAAYHFNRFVDYGLVANLVAVPVTSLWVMPWAVAAFALMPFGLEGLALGPMGLGVDIVIATAVVVGGWPGAVSLVPAMPLWGLGAIAAGGLWLCLWRRKWRYAGAMVVGVGVLSPWLQTPPDIWIDQEGRLLAVRAADGGLFLRAPRGGGGLTAETWLRRAGLREALPWPGAGASAGGELRCDRLGCTYRANGYLVALPRDTAALDDDCRRADLVVTALPVEGRCPAARMVVDRAALARDGAHQFWLGRNGAVTVAHTRAGRGERPWARAAGAVSSGAAGRSGVPGS
jgi:competence protein ComEC